MNRIRKKTKGSAAPPVVTTVPPVVNTVTIGTTLNDATSGAIWVAIVGR